MKITYKIEQYEVDNFIVVITNPEYLAGLHTRIHTPHFLLSELQQNIKTNLNHTIRRFCIKNKRYSDILRNETFEFEPDEYDRYEEHDNSCWFYTGKFIDDTRPDLLDEVKDEISYENLVRYDNSYSALSGVCHLMVDPRWKKQRSGPIRIKSLEPNKAIDVPRVRAAFGLTDKEIYKFVENQKKYAPHKGNTYGQQTVFPRHIKKNGKICFPIVELQKYISLLYKLRFKYKHINAKYEHIKQSLIDYSKNHTL